MSTFTGAGGCAVQGITVGSHMVSSKQTCHQKRHADQICLNSQPYHLHCCLQTSHTGERPCSSSQRRRSRRLVTTAMALQTEVQRKYQLTRQPSSHSCRTTHRQQRWRGPVVAIRACRCIRPRHWRQGNYIALPCADSESHQVVPTSTLCTGRRHDVRSCLLSGWELLALCAAGQHQPESGAGTLTAAAAVVATCLCGCARCRPWLYLSSRVWVLRKKLSTTALP